MSLASTNTARRSGGQRPPKSDTKAAKISATPWPATVKSTGAWPDPDHRPGQLYGESPPGFVDTAMTYAAQAVMLIAQGGFSASLWSEAGLLSASECDLPAACQLRLRAGWQPADCTPMRPPVRDRAVSDRLSLALVVRYWPISVIEA